MFLRSIEGSSQAVMTALNEGLITLNDIDEKKEEHRNTLFDWVCRHEGRDTLLPARFISVAPVRNLGLLDRDGDPNEPQVVAELIKRAIAGCEESLNHFLSYRQDSSKNVRLPATIQQHFKLFFADPAKCVSASWESFRACLDPVLEKELVQARASVKRKATAALGRPKSTTPSDPLIAALTNKDKKRMAGLDLETLRPERWEKAEQLWLGAGPELQTHLVRLPWNLVKNHVVVALEASAATEHQTYGDRTETPNWEIPKDALNKLKTKALCHWLKKAVSAGGQRTGAVAIRPRIGFKELVEDWGTLVMGEVLQGDDIGKLFEWSKQLEKLRRLQIRVVSTGKLARGLSSEERKILTVVLSGIGRLHRTSAYLPEVMFNADVAKFMDLFSWVFTRSDDDQLRFGVALLADDKFRDGLSKIFGAEGFKPVNFYLEGVEDPTKEDASAPE